jgi:hypothetical protein
MTMGRPAAGQVPRRGHAACQLFAARQLRGGEVPFAPGDPGAAGHGLRAVTKPGPRAHARATTPRRAAFRTTRDPRAARAGSHACPAPLRLARAGRHPASSGAAPAAGAAAVAVSRTATATNTSVWRETTAWWRTILLVPRTAVPSWAGAGGGTGNTSRSCGGCPRRFEVCPATCRESLPRAAEATLMQGILPCRRAPYAATCAARTHGSASATAGATHRSEYSVSMREASPCGE